MNEFHELTKTEEYGTLLERCKLDNFVITEIGVGTGALTKMILKNNPKQVIGFEIVSDLCSLQDSRFTLHIQDIKEADLSYLACNGPHGLISNPPYSLIPDISKWVSSSQAAWHDVILMVRPKHLALFPDFTTEFILDRFAFTPNPNCDEHIVIRRGFMT
ncbi:hypothetical protein KBD61_00735 [Patescibacteria group bacterium]|nr:hypothetical protein [Patescibacteria group bacterium]MBP9709533.1 hypothetical protein [Patescibacteria group bacterium]